MIDSVREVGINPNHWYVVARSSEVTTDPYAVTLWKQPIVLYRQRDGQVCALEDRCPHRFVKLSEGKVQRDRVECAYHGWQFNAEGKCVSIPYLMEKQKLPPCQLRSYPVQEGDGFIWIFLGDEPVTVPRFQVPEWDHLNYIATVSVIETQAHYSYLIENLMDMYHGHLHEDWQAWTDAKLENIEEDDSQVHGYYDAQSYYRIDKIWSISQLFFPGLRQLHPEPLTVSYIYPHWVSTLGEDFKIYCLFSPIHETATRAYLIHFTSLNAFWRLHKLPVWFRRGLKNALFGSAQKLFDGLVRQDVAMIEQEQAAFLENPHQKGYEFNPVLGSVQRLIRKQASA
ncbi:MAG: aromatic ring-hydroxylating dioxygenase subunit alpha [Halothece sp. Uz-M2-17]|nr:aromatic ring-hydroxylating dioxygenase subunit alpha [Halothece sp. Uz-M2-17]